MDVLHDHPVEKQTQDSDNSLRPFAALALQSSASGDSEANKSDDRDKYPYSIEQAETYFLNAGYIVAQRTISHYCQTNQFQCKKFSSCGVRRWFIKKSSVDRHLKQLRTERPITANDSKPSHANASPEIEREPQGQKSFAKAIASDSIGSQATADYESRYIRLLENQIDIKDSQIKSLQVQVDELAIVTKGLGGLLSEANNSSRSREQNNYQNNNIKHGDTTSDE